MRRLLYAAAIFAVTGCMTDRTAATNPEPSPKLREALAGRTAGPPTSCINLRDIRSSRIIDESAIIYEMSSRLWYVNMPDGGCPGLHPNRALVSRTPSTSLCRGDIVRIIDPPSPMTFGACGLGKFVPYTK
jgi:hypothetical protein